MLLIVCIARVCESWEDSRYEDSKYVLPMSVRPSAMSCMFLTFISRVLKGAFGAHILSKSAMHTMLIARTPLSLWPRIWALDRSVARP